MSLNLLISLDSNWPQRIPAAGLQGSTQKSRKETEMAAQYIRFIVTVRLQLEQLIKEGKQFFFFITQVRNKLFQVKLLKMILITWFPNLMMTKRGEVCQRCRF